MMFKHTVCLLLLLAIQATAQSSSSSSDDKPTEDLSFSDQNQEQPQSEPSVEEPATEELDTSDPTLWQMAAFSARQMSTKSMKTKLSTLNSAERIASANGFLYKLRVTYHRFSLQQPTGSSNDVYYCTVEIKTDSNGKQWNVDNFGCTIPALIRHRTRPATTTTTPIPIKPERMNGPIVLGDDSLGSYPLYPSKPILYRMNKPYRSEPIQNTLMYDNEVDHIVARSRFPVKRHVYSMRTYHQSPVAVYRRPYSIYSY